MNFNQLTAAAAAAAAGNPGNINMNSFTTAVSNILANSNIDLSQLASLSGLGGSAALSAAANSLQQQRQSPATIPSSRHNLTQAHHHRHSSSANNSTSIASLNSNTHINNSISNLANADALAGLPASLSNLTNSALADLAANAASIAAHQSSQQPNVRSSSSSIQSAHHRSSSSSAAAAAAVAALANQQHHLNHHSSPAATITAAHQSTSAAKALAAHQSHNISTSHHRHSSSSHNNAHNSSYNNLNINNNVSKNSISNSFNTSFSNLTSSIVNNNNLSNSSNNHITTTAKIPAVTSAVAAASAAPTQTIIATNNINSVTPPKDSICYRIGDCVYYESSPTLPLQIGKIDEVCRISGDNIEVKVVSFFRRRDISSSLMTLADKYQYDEVQEEEIKQMSDEDKNVLRQRELFYSRQIETIPATAIRGKCTVQLLNESETLASYISKEDHYFYTLVYDPQQKTITADRGEIRVGQRYQAEVQPNPIYTPQLGGDSADPRDLNEMESMVYTPDHNLTDDDINKFLTIAKSVGTFARALDCSSSIKQPSLHLTAASASRDVTLLYAMQILHANNYDLGKAVCALVPSTGPVLCRDEIEEWTAGEATLFEEAIEKYGREFNEIRQDILPWKSVKNIVEYYYMWKTTDRSINQRRMKALEAENKVSVLFISDPENKSLKETTTNASNSEANVKKTSTNITSVASSSSTTVTTSASGTSSGSSGVPPVSVAKEEPNTENPNATLKRRQVTEQLPKHTTPGENLRWLATVKIKKMRYDNMTKKQLRHMSRCPWERRAALTVPK